MNGEQPGTRDDALFLLWQRWSEHNSFDLPTEVWERLLDMYPPGIVLESIKIHSHVVRSQSPEVRTQFLYRICEKQAALYSYHN